VFLLIDKPKGITSHDVVDRVRKIVRDNLPLHKGFGEAKVGHAGTLDPNATGLLIVGVGRDATKKLGVISKGTMKTYQAEIFLGAETDTDDAEGVVISKAKGFLPPSEKEVRNTLRLFSGRQEQIPPEYSAIKIKGRKAYELARKGVRLSLRPRKITIYSIELVSYNYPILKINCKVSSGTYIRALGRDIGRKLGCGAYLKNLRRTKIGECKVGDSVKLDSLNKSNWKDFLVFSKYR